MRLRLRTTALLAACALALAAPAAALGDGQISGTVTDEEGNALAAALVTTIDEDDGTTEVETDDTGAYTISVPAGDYVVQFDGPPGSQFVTEYFDDQPSFDTADAVTVEDSQTTADVDAALAAGGSISGKVTDASGDAIADAVVEAIPPGAGDIVQTTTDASGEYILNGLTAGDYAVSFAGPPGSFHVFEYYNDKRTLQEADVVSVGVGATTTDIDASLAAGGRITGTVETAGGDPIADAEVLAVPESENGEVVETLTDADGTYTLDGLESGEYVLAFSGGDQNFALEYYDDHAAFEDADPVRVTAGAVTAGIDAALAAGGRITGKVTTASGDPVADAVVDAVPAGDGAIVEVTTGADGTYDIFGLATGDYAVRFSGPDDSNLATEYYNDKATLESADEVHVTVGATTPNVDAALATGAAIRGTVTDADGNPLANAEVAAFPPGAGEPHVATADGAGEYIVRGLAAADYTVQFNAPFGSAAVTEYYNDKTSFDAADRVTTTAGETRTGIDASLAAGARITGRVTSDAGNPLTGAPVIATPVGGGDNFFATTGDDGDYDLARLPAGAYNVQFQSPPGAGFTSEYYSDKPTRAEADPVDVIAGATTEDIDASLATGGALAGTVTDADGAPIRGARVSASPVDGGPGGQSASTDTNGRFTIAGLAPGSYRLSYRGPVGSDFVTRFYDGKATLGASDPVAVEAGETTAALDAVLPRGGRIGGRITDAGGAAIAGAAVTVTPADGSGVGGFAGTAADGTYTVAGLVEGAYEVEVEGPYDSDYVPRSLEGTVAVTAGQTTPGVDAVLAAGGRITGTVTGPDGKAVAEAVVSALPPAGGAARTVVTGSDGSYALTGVAVGGHRVRFVSPEAQDLATEYFTDRVAAALADEVAVTAGTTTRDVDARLEAGGRIAGTVTDPAGNPVPGARVKILDAAGNEIAATDTAADGTYALRGLRAGTYRVRFEAAGFTAVEVPVTVVAGETTRGVDGRLAAPAGGGGGGTVPGPGPGPGPGAGAGPPTPKPLARLLAPSSLKVRAGRVGMRIRCSGAGRCAGTVRLLITRAVRGRTTRQTIARGRLDVAAGGTQTVRLRLTAAGRRLVRRKARTRVTLELPAPAGAKPTTTRMTLRR